MVEVLASDRSVSARGDRFAVWSAAVTSLLAVVSFALAVTTPPRTGPFAQAAVLIKYPYAEASRFVPRDFLWMYPATLMMLAFVVLAACILHRASARLRLFGVIGVCLATVSFTVIVIDYFIQLRTVQVALLCGEASSVVALSQYNPHGVFIALEEAGFLVAAVSFVFLALALASSSAQATLPRAGSRGSTRSWSKATTSMNRSPMRRDRSSMVTWCWRVDWQLRSTIPPSMCSRA